MIKSILTATALMGLAGLTVPAASAQTFHKANVVTKRVVPVAIVSARNNRVIRATNRRSVIAVRPRVKIVTPVVKIVTPVVTKKKVVPVRTRRVIRR